MTTKKMAAHAKGWKTPAERADMKKAMRDGDPPRSEVKKAGKVAAKAPPNTTDSKDGGPDGWKSKRSLKQPKGC